MSVTTTLVYRCRLTPSAMYYCEGEKVTVNAHRSWQFRAIVALSLVITLLFHHLTPTLAGFPFGINVPSGIPSSIRKPVQDKVDEQIYGRIGKLLGVETPLLLDAKTAFPKVDVKGFNPVDHGNLTSSDMWSPLTEGDHTYHVRGYCSLSFSHAPRRGIAYKVGRLQGKMSDVLTQLTYELAVHPEVNRSPMQFVVWYIQNGVPISQWSEQNRRFVKSLIPYDMERLNGNGLELVRNKYNDIRSSTSSFGLGKVSLPSFENALDHLGGLGKVYKGMMDAQGLLKDKTLSHQQILDRSYEPQNGGLPAVSDPQDSPWSELAKGVYVRFTIENGYSSTNKLDVRVTRQALQPAPSSGVKQQKVAQIWEEVLLWELLFGVAEAGTEVEAVTVGTEAGVGAVAGQAGADEIAIEAIRRAIRAKALKALITYPIRTIVQPLVLMAEMPKNNGEGGGNQRPPRDLCNKAIKILTQYERLAQKFGVNIGNKRIAELNRLRDTGQITINDIPGSLRGEFPTGTFGNITLKQVRNMCGM